MFDDPAGQYRCELPRGWAYDHRRSHLITVAFEHWLAPGERLTVRAMPAHVAAEAAEDVWRKALGERVFGRRFQPVDVRTLGGRPVAIGEARGEPPTPDEAGPVHRRIALARGLRLDVLIEHRAPDHASGPLFSPPLAAILASLAIPADEAMPRLVDQAAVAARLEAAVAARATGDWAGVATEAGLARRDAQASYVWSITGNAMMPEVPAALAVADALHLIGQATAELIYPRAAEALLYRARITLEGLPFLPAARRRAVGSAIADRLGALVATEMALLRPADRGRPAGNLVQRAWTRSDSLFKRARTMLAATDAPPAIRALAGALLRGAIDDLQTVAAAAARLDPGAAERLPAALRARFDDLAAEDRARALAAILRRSAAQALGDMMLWETELHARDGAPGRAQVTRSFSVALADHLAREETVVTGRTLLPDPGAERRVVVALMQRAAGSLELADAGALESAEGDLARVAALLETSRSEAIGERATLIASHVLSTARFLHLRRSVANGVAVIERGLAALDDAPPDARALYESELRTMLSQFLLNDGALDRAAETARAVTMMPEGATAADRRRRASHFLNLALVETKRGRTAAAVAAAAAALARTAGVGALDEGALRLLMAASEIVQPVAPALDPLLKAAAAEVLEALSASIAGETARIAHDDATLRRETTMILVDALIRTQRGAAALVAADRGRARALRSLGAEIRTHEPAATVAAFDPGGREGLALIEAAARHLMARAGAMRAAEGASPALDAAALPSLAARIGAPVLLLQPVPGRLALFVLGVDGAVAIRFAALAPDAVATAIAAANRALGIHATLRGGLAPAQGPADLDALLGELHAALIAPVADLLAGHDRLVVVPYREYALVPYAVLLDRDGRALAETTAVSIAASLAVLDAAMHVPTRAWHERRRAYVVGDPAFGARHLFARLPSAATEARAVATAIDAAGLTAEPVRVVTGDAATEADWRAHAPGASLVHLACHAELREPVDTSYLLLAPHGPHDGMLLAGEIGDVRLDEGLVFLATRESGQGWPTTDSVVGLGRSFLAAGARAIILSLWRVEDHAGAYLGAAFYRHFTARPADGPASALRAAMIETRNALATGAIRQDDGTALPPHPALWAAYVVVGDAGPDFVSA
ncbi:MAG: CHAT domain-containing protein [Alphaproteobacteria bacterium]|nr:CHAT domain-containing protein [Alphaproteobacteria bacterium]